MYKNTRPTKTLEVWLPIEALCKMIEQPFAFHPSPEIPTRESYVNLEEGADPLEYRRVFLSDYGKSFNHIVVRQGWPDGWKRSQIESYLAGIIHSNLKDYFTVITAGLSVLAQETLEKEEKEE